MPSIQEEIVHVKGFPKKLIIFLHGYIDNADSINQKVQYLVDSLDNIAIHIPEAPHICEIHDSKRQWYSMHRFDPNDDRKFVTTIEECSTIYERMKLGLVEASTYLNHYIDQCLFEYGLTDKDLFICGFSQGATLAIYTALTRDEKIAGCISFGGIIAPQKYLETHYQNTPDFLLVHGSDDNLVRPEALELTKKSLQKLGSHVDTFLIPNGQHRITEDGTKKMSLFIKQRINDIKLKKVANM